MASSGLGVKRIKVSGTRIRLGDKDRDVRSFFLDSGAHSLYNKHCYHERRDSTGRVVGTVYKAKSIRFKWFSKDGTKLTKQFREYIDRYAAFVKEHQKNIEYYATVDVIYNPELSWLSINYLKDEHGLNPVPVIHNHTSVKWVAKYVEAGFDYIGLGGLGQKSTKARYYDWADSVYDYLCDNPKRLPCVRTHGFAMTSWEMVCRYPWWSTDGSTAYKVAGYGAIFVPPVRNGKFVFTERDPYCVGFSYRSSARAEKNKHYETMTSGQQALVRRWLEEIEVPMGKMGEDERTLEYGVVSEYNARATANLKYFQRLCAALPEWPWPFERKQRTGFFSRESIK